MASESGCAAAPSGKSVVISLNPIAGSRCSLARVDRLVELLKTHALEPEVLTDLDVVAQKTNELHQTGDLRALVAVGGDGTAQELVNRTQPGVPITLLPSGNENLLAKYLGIGRSPEDVARVVAFGKPIQLDASRANDRIFLLMLGVGFDAEVVRRVHDWRTNHRQTGHVRSRNYIKPILSSIRTYQYPEIRIEHDDYFLPGADDSPPGMQMSLPSPLAARWLFVFNLPCYGGGMQFTPNAVGSDGQLDVCAFRRGSLWHGLRYAGAVYCGRHQRLADCISGRVRRMRIAADGEVPYQLDGDPGGTLPVEVEVLPGRLTVLTPPVSTE